MLYVRLERGKKGIHLSEGKPLDPIASMHHWKVKSEEEVINTTAPESSVDLSEDAIFALSMLQKAFHPV